MPGFENGKWDYHNYGQRTLDRDKFDEFKTRFGEAVQPGAVVAAQRTVSHNYGWSFSFDLSFYRAFNSFNDLAAFP